MWSTWPAGGGCLLDFVLGVGHKLERGWSGELVKGLFLKNTDSWGWKRNTHDRDCSSEAAPVKGW